MENTLLVGLSRQMALSRQIDVVANNVANLNTNGYKADGSIFEEFIMPTARETQFQQNQPGSGHIHPLFIPKARNCPAIGISQPSTLRRIKRGSLIVVPFARRSELDGFGI